MNTVEILTRLGPKLGTGLGERPFLTGVVALMPNDAFDPNSLDAQRHFFGIDGGDCWMDFCIVESDEVRVSIEIDGYDKRGTGTFERRDWQAWLHRQNALVAQGWRVVRLANAEVLNNPGRCSRVVLGTLREARKVARHSLALTGAVRELESARAQLVCAEAERGVAQSQLDELRQLLLAKQEAVAVATAGDSSLANQLKDGDRLRAEQDAALLKSSLDEVEGMKVLGKWFAVAMVLTVAMLIGFVVYWTGRSTGEGVATPQPSSEPGPGEDAVRPGAEVVAPPAVAALPSPASPAVVVVVSPEPAPPATPSVPKATDDPCAGDVPWNRASACEGRVVTVVGALAGIKHLGTQTALNIGEDFPSGFTIFLQTKIGAPHDTAALLGKQVRTTGVVVGRESRYGVRHEIVQKSWQDIHF